MVLEDLNGEKIVGMLYGKELQKRNEFRIEKVRKKTINYMSNGKDMIILLAVGLIKKILLYEMCYFLEPYTLSRNKRKLNYICLFMQQNLIY